MRVDPDVIFFDAITDDDVALVGGKGAQLAALSRIEGIRVPDGFCITTRAFDRALAAAAIDERLDPITDAATIRRAIEAAPVPRDLADAITRAVARLGEHAAYAVRSSATAEDLPTASFAGQQDTFLNVTGAAAVLRHVAKCWASLFTDRAVSYRERNGFDHRKVHMAVVVQRMVTPRASGVLFTADPISGHRKVSTIEAIVGLGEALVSGHANPDMYEVRDGASGGNVAKKNVGQPTLTDEQARQLAALGRRIEARFGRPQDIEWCLADDGFHFVQSRPITTLFPIPARTDDENHVYLSVGHQQMMTDAMKPLGISFWQLIAAGPMHEAGGRMFVDITRALASPASRANLLALFGKGDPLANAVQSVVDRGDFLPAAPPDAPADDRAPRASGAMVEANPRLVTELVAEAEGSLATLKREIQGQSGAALLDFILADIQETKRVLSNPKSTQVVMAGIRAVWWLNEHLERWLGETNLADALAQSVPHNPTSEMGLALLDVADVVRPHPEVVAYLEHAGDDAFLDGLDPLEGGAAARAAIEAWLERYGMRCPGEIDITRPRFRERPTMLAPMILSNVKTFAPGEAARRFAQGREEAAKRERELLGRLRALPDGETKAAEAKSMIDRVRAFMGYREYPKYGMVNRTFVYKQALLDEANRLVRAGVIAERDDVFYLRFDELRAVVRDGAVDATLLRERKEAFTHHSALVPPRVLTSDGEVIGVSYQREDVPAGALVGLAVSAGVVEGRARVVLDIAKADLAPGDILVTKFTDPSWTPLFVAVRGLVTEVGGLMTHGAVIAREYGLPAVVGVEHATTRIRDGQRIRVDGTSGYVELLTAEGESTS